MPAQEEEAIMKLPPRERIKALRDLREQKKRELEELEKKRKQDLEEAEELLKESLEDLTEDEEHEEERLKKLRGQMEDLRKAQEEAESLEETVDGSDIPQVEAKQYGIPQEQVTGGYTPLNKIVDDLNHLQYTDNWSQREVDLYQTRKQELSQTQQYAKTMADELVEQLDTAQNIMKRLGYRTE